jgi:UDP-hydrolysing UDP-N-acetyl-D-glucosamine 2-epimerase
VRKVCVFIGSRANYSSIKSVMRAVQQHPDLHLQLIVGASALLDRFGSVVDVIVDDGFTPDARVTMIVEGETPATMAKSTGLGLLELPTLFELMKPDVVISVGDRFETMATAIAAAYMNIPVAHTMGGEISGTIDESIRHAVTKLSHVHFPANTAAAERIIRMGEHPDTVHMVGCPRIDVVSEIASGRGMPHEEWLDREGVGAHIDVTRPFLLVNQHPVTTEYGHGKEQIWETLWALDHLKMPTVMLWPNVDAGSEDIATAMRTFREKVRPDYIRFYKNFPIETYVRLMVMSACAVGNSSASIREGAFLGLPAVNIGTRQAGRDRANNVVDVGYSRDEIVEAVRRQVAHGRYPSDPQTCSLARR